MEQEQPQLVSGIRSASRDLVRELGFMNRTLAGTRLSPSAVHAIIEIGKAGDLSAMDLADRLLLEKSTISRLVKSLEDTGQVRARRSERDARIKHLELTRQGARTLSDITRYAEQQVEGALSLMEPDSQRDTLSGLQAYSAALRGNRLSGEPVGRRMEPTIGEGYVPGLVGRVVELHGSYYRQFRWFGPAFETEVAAGLAEFVPRLGTPANAIWRAERWGTIRGSIAIDGEDLGDGKAHLRWFIVSPELHGTGLGRRLIQRAVDHCDSHGFPETHLWTVKGLNAARNLYEQNGFVLAEEYPGRQWGVETVEQHFVRAWQS